MSLRFLHISDIHFKHFDGKVFLDRDHDIRNELEIDLQNLCTQVGKIDAILIGGDIAFGGKDAEYKIAEEWINKICSIAGCEQVNVLTVPGNHDIDRDQICQVVNTIQSDFKGCKSREVIDEKLHGYLKSEQSYSILLKPLKAYHAFAQRYGTIPGQNPLYWDKDLKLGDYTLRIRGINSAVVSSDKDNENTSKLIVGSLQTTLIRDEKVIYLTLCHHPPDWLIDATGVDQDLIARAKLHLFGHKHTFSTTRLDNTLRLAAGAMQPSRKESNWEPRYNIISLEVQESTKPKLTVEIWRRKWDKNDKCFIPEHNEDGEEKHEYSLPIKSTRVRVASKNKAKKAGGKKGSKVKKVKAKVKIKIVEEKVEVIDINNPEPLRQITYMLVALPFHKKMEVGTSLNLIIDSDADLDEIGITTAFLTRAEERGIMGQLWDKVVEGQAIKTEKSNPYKKEN